MWIRRLKVCDLAGIREAELEFGPGLNVCHGPNELGKSTLVESIRAALLLQDSSTAASALADWHADAAPSVELTFETEPERIWRVRKSFGSGRDGSSYLEFSRDGRTFVQEARGREVDGRLAELLRWGIESPGGHARRKRGVPESFITTALLGKQEAVTAILERSLEEDPDASGRELLKEALQAMSEDPAFGRAVGIAQAKVDEAFTATGRKRSGSGSPWIEIRDQLNAAEDRRREVEALREQSEASRRSIERLHEELLAARARQEEAERDRAALEQAWTGQHEWRVAEEALAAARAEENRIRAIAEDVSRLERERQRAQSKKAEVDADLQSAAEALELATKAVQDRRERVRALESGADEQQRRIREQEAEKKLLSLNAKKQEIEARVRQCERVGSHVSRAEELRTEIESLESGLIEARSVLREAKESATADEKQLRALRLRERAARYLTLKTALERAEADEQVSARQRSEAERLEAEAEATQRELASWAVPDAAELSTLRELATELRIAEEKLQVGLSVTVSPQPGVDVQVEMDGAAAETVTQAPRELEAKQRLVLRIQDAVEIDVRGGTHELQEAADRLSARWNEASSGIFQRTGCASLEALEELRQRGAEQERRVQGLRSQASDARTRSDGGPREGGDPDRLREESQQARESLERMLPEHQTLDGFLTDLEDGVADRAAALREESERLRDQAEERRNLASRLEAGVSGDAGRLESLQEESEAQEREIEEASQGLSHGWEIVLESARAELLQLQSENDQLNGQIALLRDESAGEVSAARESLAAGERESVDKKQRVEEAQQRVQEAVAHVARLEGEFASQSDLLAREDLAASQEAVAEKSQALAALERPSREITEELRQQARHDVEGAADVVRHLNLDLRQAEGALEQVGGQYIDEQVEQAREAAEAIRERQNETQMEYESWQLLLEALKEAEQEGAQNLGNALVEPISERMQALTAGRYESVTLDPDLQTTAINMGDGLRSHAALSLGTQEQLATILRLSIAEALGSFLVLDDQLVQSDAGRMAWIRNMLETSAGNVQIIVFTCRPDDYLRVEAGSYLSPRGERGRIVDLAEAVERTISGPLRRGERSTAGLEGRKQEADEPADVRNQATDVARPRTPGSPAGRSVRGSADEELPEEWGVEVVGELPEEWGVEVVGEDAPVVRGRVRRRSSAPARPASTRRPPERGALTEDDDDELPEEWCVEVVEELPEEWGVEVVDEEGPVTRRRARRRSGTASRSASARRSREGGDSTDDGDEFPEEWGVEVVEGLPEEWGVEVVDEPSERVVESADQENESAGKAPRRGQSSELSKLTKALRNSLEREED